MQENSQENSQENLRVNLQENPQENSQKKTSRASRLDRAGVVVAVILFGLAALLWRETQTMSGAVTYGVGPTAALKFVSFGLAVLGIMTLISAFRSSGQIGPDEMDAMPVVIILAACATMIACLRLGVGFIPAMSILFAATATAFGRRKIPVDLAIGFGVGLAIYLLFSKVLTLNLPQGPIERLIG